MAKLGTVVAAFLLLSPTVGLARVSPLSAIERQIQTPNILLVLDTSISMLDLPGENDLDLQEAGADCEDGDEYCRTIGTKGRCFFSSGGRFGSGVKNDYVDCTTDAQCTSKAYCKSNAPMGCARDSDCGGSTKCVGICDNGSNCTGDAGCGTGTCHGVCNDIAGQLCTSHSQCAVGDPCSYNPVDFCVKNNGSSMRMKMCRLSLAKCQNDSHCQSIAGDSCGPATSRLRMAKLALNGLVQKFFRDVNFGFMTFTEKDYYPYFEITTPTTIQVRTKLLDRATLEAAVPPCFSSGSGPSASCSLSGTTYSLIGSNNSRYRLNRGTHFESVNTSWSPTCTVECLITDEGTGIYEGSYYAHDVPVGTPTTSLRRFSDYAGKTRSADGLNYYYADVPATIRNVGNVYGVTHQPTLINSAHSQSSCGVDTGAIWNPDITPFMDTARNLSAADAATMARRLHTAFDKASFGGIMSSGGTPTGCALKNEGTGASYDRSAYHYLEKVKAENLANGVSCRPNHVILLTDGIPKNVGEIDCSHADCALEPPGPGCQCKSVTSARSLYRDLGVKVHVVGFSGAVSYAYATASLNNIAKAGGSTKAYFAIQRSELDSALTGAIYDAVRGSYSTSPIAVGGGGASNGTVVLDARTDFPTWKGHLIAYEAGGAGTQVLWDAATGFDATANPNFWKSRNVWTSNGAAMVKIEVDPAGAITNAATLQALGLGVTTAEAALVARWMLGDPALGNPAVLGAIVNSTPTQVGTATQSLTYVGASDGMLHAFHSKAQSIGGTAFAGGAEAFAYIPQDMLKTIRRLFAQGGQRMSPADHIFGLANSPKVRKVCTANCADAGLEQWKTILVMPQGMGGEDLFALDVSSPFSASGVKSSVGAPPVTLLWNTETSIGGAAKASYDAALGKTISLPGFYFAKSAARDDYRTIFASGYTEASTGSKGLRLIDAAAASGNVIASVSTVGLGASCSKPRVDPTEPTLLSDVAIARRFGAADYERIAAAYAGDTWGNLFRYVPPADSTGLIQSGAGSLTAVDGFSCSHPLHFAPTVVQLDRHDDSKHPGEIYLAQVTNSPLDALTSAVTASFPASQIIIRRDLAASGSGVSADGGWGSSGGRIVLNANNPAEICGVWNAASKTCTTALPAAARPLGSPTAVLRDDYQGFALISSWYVPDSNGCTKGDTYLVIHQVDSGAQVSQMYGQNVGSEPVVGAVFAGGKLLVVLENGPKEIMSSGLGAISSVAAPAATGTALVDRYRRIGWTELP